MATGFDDFTGTTLGTLPAGYEKNGGNTGAAIVVADGENGLSLRTDRDGIANVQVSILTSGATPAGIVQIAARLKINSTSSSNIPALIARTSGNDDRGAAALSVTPTHLGINAINQAVTSDFAHGLNPLEWFNARFEYNPATGLSKAKVWASGEEPADWSVEKTLATTAVTGYLGFGNSATFGPNRSATFDWVGWATDGDVAPLGFLGGASATPVAFTGTVPTLNGTEGTAFSDSVASYFSGTETPFTYAVHAGTLPAGLTLNTSTGVISGTPTTAGTSSGIVIRATDATPNTADSNAFDIVVDAAPTAELAWTAAPTITARTTTSYTITATPSAACTVYAVALAAGSATPSNAQIVAGTNAAGVAALATASTVSSGAAVTLTLSGLGANPTYDIHVVGYEP